MKTVYKCDYCNKEYASTQGCIMHETQCNFNPTVGRCFACEYNDIFSSSPFCRLGMNALNCNVVKNCTHYKEKLK